MSLLESGVEEPFQKNVSERQYISMEDIFSNSSAVDLISFLKSEGDTEQAIDNYIQQFSPSIIDIFERLEFKSQVEKLVKIGLLSSVAFEFSKIDLHLASVSHGEMGDIFDMLIGKFAEISNEIIGEYFTPRDIVALMVNVLFFDEKKVTAAEAKQVSVYDPTAGTGGLLSASVSYFEEKHPREFIAVFGQELNDESAAICKANMLFRGKDVKKIVVGNTLTDDAHSGRKFDYIVSTPPFGVEWKRAEKIIRQEYEKKGFQGRFGPGLPRMSDSSLLFILNQIDKMKPSSEGGSRICTVVTGSSLRSGGVSSGESDIRKWIVENDLLEAVIALPNSVFFNVAIPTYILVISNKPRSGGIRLINASGLWEPMNASIGRKSRYISPEYIVQILSIYKNENSDLVRMVSKSDLLYRNFTSDVGGNLTSRNVPLSKNHADYLRLTESLGIAVKIEKKHEIGCEIDFFSFFSNQELTWASTLPLFALIEACDKDSSWDIGIKDSGILFKHSCEGEVDEKSIKFFKVRKEVVLPKFLEIYVEKRSTREDSHRHTFPSISAYLEIRIDCPSLKKQQAIIDFYSQKSEFLIRLARIEQEQWENSTVTSIFNKRIGEYSDGSDYLMKILPHPLASLLYKIQCERSKRDVLEAYRVFFECLGAVLSSIALGVIYEDKGKKECFEAVANRGRITRPTMGSYQNILRRCREKSVGSGGYGSYVLSLVASKEVEDSLANCTEIRNEISHRGLIKPSELGDYIDRFESILSIMADAIGDFFAENFIAKQLHQKWNGRTYENDVLSLTGIASYPFERRIKYSAEPLIFNELYLFQGIDEKNGAKNQIRLFHFMKCVEIIDGSDNEGFYFLNSIARDDLDERNIFHFSAFQPLIESKKIIPSEMLDEISGFNK